MSKKINSFILFKQLKSQNHPSTKNNIEYKAWVDQLKLNEDSRKYEILCGLNNYLLKATEKVKERKTKMMTPKARPKSVADDTRVTIEEKKKAVATQEKKTRAKSVERKTRAKSVRAQSVATEEQKSRAKSKSKTLYERDPPEDIV